MATGPNEPPPERPGLVSPTGVETAPALEVVDALSGIACDDDRVRLGRVARRAPLLEEAVLRVLDDSEEPRAATMANGMR